MNQTTQSIFNIKPVTLNSAKIANMLSSSQLHDFVNNEKLGFTMRKKLRNTSNSEDVDLQENSFISDSNLKHHLKTEERRAVIKARIIFKHRARKIWTDFNISSIFAYSNLKSYKEDGVNNKFVVKVKEKTFLNCKEALFSFN